MVDGGTSVCDSYPFLHIIIWMLWHYHLIYHLDSETLIFKSILHLYCQAQFQLASSVELELRLVLNLIITTHPTPVPVVIRLSRPCRKLKFAMWGMVWYGMVWYGMVWFGLVWFVNFIMDNNLAGHYNISKLALSLAQLQSQLVSLS